MRILQINSVYGYGSTGRIVENLHKGIQADGHESYVIYGRGSKSKDKNVFLLGNKVEQAIDLLGTRLFNKHGQYNYINTSLIIRKIKEIQPDIVHLHNIHGYYVNYAKLFNFLEDEGIPVIWLLHDRWPISGSSPLYDSEKINWEKPNVSEIKRISFNYPKYFYFNSKSAINSYKHKKKYLKINNLVIVTPSNWLKNEIEKSFFKNINKHVIYNGIDIEKFKPTKVTKLLNKKVLLGVANNWDNNKGLNFFNRLAKDLDDKFEIILVGTDESVQKKINKRITCIHKTNNIEELVKIYSSADIFINPTLDDNFPSVNIESQACGTPVITFNTGGSGESIAEGTGKIIEKGNYDNLKEAIEKWPKKNTEIIDKCVMNAKNYSIDNMIYNYLKIYYENY